jgi:hypothetical protein
MKKENKESITTKILYGVAALIMLGSVTFFGNAILTAINKIDQVYTDNLLIKNDLKDVVKDLQNTIGTTATLSATVKNLEITTAKLETVIERIKSK